MLNIADFADPHSPWVYVVHVCAGAIILALGLVAIASRKGSKAHISAGRAFVVLSVIAGVTALLFLGDIGFVPNIYGTSVLAISVVTFSFLALQAPSNTVKAMEGICLLLTLSAAIILLHRFWVFSREDGLISEAAFFTFGCAFFPLYFLLYDLYFTTRDREKRVEIRLKRHASGMAFVIAVMVHAPVVSVFTDVSANFYVKFFGPYLLWPAIYYYFAGPGGQFTQFRLRHSDSGHES